jgi:hypothetical protein
LFIWKEKENRKRIVSQHRQLDGRVDRAIIEANIGEVRARLSLVFRHFNRPELTNQERQDLRSHLQTLVDAAEISRYDSVENAEKIIRSGKFKAVIEREQERIVQKRPVVLGEDYITQRKLTENLLFGIPDADSVNRPIYGIASNGRDTAAKTYGRGEVRFVFRSDIRQFATMTGNDSVNATTVSSPPYSMSKSLVPAVLMTAIEPEVLGLNLVLKPLPEMLQCNSLDELLDLMAIDYFEVQLHTDISLSDIQRIEFRPDIRLSKVTLEWAERNNISLIAYRNL